MKRLNTNTYLRSLLSTVPDAMVVVDEHGRIVSFNHTAEEIFGYSREEVVGKHITLLLPANDRHRQSRHLERYIQTGKPRFMGMRRVGVAQRKDGSAFPIELSVGEAHTPGGRLLTGFVRDITEQRQAEERLGELQQEFDRVTRASVISSLASALAHELNQPLTAITSFLEGALNLLEAPDPSLPVIRDIIHEASHESVRAGRIIQRLRDFILRGESEKQIARLSGIIHEITMLAQFGAPESDVDLHVSIPPDADLILVDSVQIHQVLLNLLRNAVEVMRDLPVRKLTIESRARPSDMIEVIVSDTGTGIDEEQRSHLFEPFYTTKDDGMGLGLPICRAIIEANGGRMWVESVTPQGAAFHFTLQAATVCEVDRG